MDYQELDILEDRITKAVELINILRHENEELKQQNAELLTKAEENEGIIQKLREDYQNLNQLQEQTEQYREKEEKIKSKVEGMLSKLESLQFTT